MSSSQQPTPAYSAPQTPHTYGSASSAGPSRQGTVEPSVLDDDEMDGEEDGDGMDDDEHDEDDEDDEMEEVEVDDSLSSRAVTPALHPDQPAPPNQAPTPIVQIVTDPLKPPKTGKALNFKKKTKTESLNVKGVVYQVVDDEITLDTDPRGEAKIDADGNLLGGRQFKLHTFTSPMRKNPNKQYMLSIDAARAAGYRDSLYFFRKNPLIHKITCSQTEKEKLIDLGKLSNNLRSRAITMVSARNVFKMLGAKFVLNGKYVFDDYYEDRSIAEGHKPGELAHVEQYDAALGPDSNAALAAKKAQTPFNALGSGLNALAHAGKPTKQNPNAAANGDPMLALASSFGGTGVEPFGQGYDAAQKRGKPAAHLTPENWMLEYAKNVREVNAELAKVRGLNVGEVGVGHGVVEREEDCWVSREVEVDSEEEEAEADKAALGGGTPAPPGGATLAPVGGGVGSARASPAPTAAGLLPPTTSAPGQPPAKRRKIVKVYNPIRGIYDPETYIPHVPASTQPTTATVYKVDGRPHLFGDLHEAADDEAEDGNDEAGSERRQWARERRVLRRWERVAGRRGVASVEYGVDPGAGERGEPLVPGMWDFGAGPEGVVLE